jgi:hypothetical protein
LDKNIFYISNEYSVDSYKKSPPSVYFHIKTSIKKYRISSYEHIPGIHESRTSIENPRRTGSRQVHIQTRKTLDMRMLLIQILDELCLSSSDPLRSIQIETRDKTMMCLSHERQTHLLDRHPELTQGPENHFQVFLPLQSQQMRLSFENVLPSLGLSTSSRVYWTRQIGPLVLS